jgi:3-oxoacyl-[acyl-carrier protein] reductase
MESSGRSPDVVCNVAGYLLPALVEATTVRDVDLHIDVNVKGVILGTRRCAQSMLAAGRGHIINIASLAGMSAVPGLSLYSASKFAVRGFSLSVAQELRGRGVAVTVVCPDAVQTPMLDLQLDYEESALVFSGARALSTADVCAAITGRVLRDRPLEVALPGWRGVLARIGGAAPGVAAASEPLLRRVGRLNLERARRARSGV